MQSKIGLIGIGMVGRPAARYFEEVKGLERGRDLFLYDSNPAKNANDDINQAELVFICVPTPRSKDGAADLSYLEAVFEKLSGEKIAVIKSTIPPGTTEAFQKKYLQHKILFNPEFLDAKFAWEQFIKPPRQIMGFTSASREIAPAVLALLPKAPFTSQIAATEAELVKYASNIHYARKVNFVNIVASLAEKLGVNYDNVRQAMAADYRIGDSHLDVLHGGYRGFAGGCLPKDLSAFIAHLEARGLTEEAELLRRDSEFNRKLLASQGLELEDMSVPDHDLVAQKKLNGNGPKAP